MQDIKNQIVQDFLSGDRKRMVRAAKLYEDTFGLEQIQSEAVSCGEIVPNRLLEFDLNNLGVLEESLPKERMVELEAGAEPTSGERKRYRASIIRQVKDGDSDANETPGFWIHAIRDKSGDEIFALTTATGYSFSGISSQFHGLFSWERDCIEFLKKGGVVADISHLRPTPRKETSNQLSLKLAGKSKKKSSQKSTNH